MKKQRKQLSKLLSFRLDDALYEKIMSQSKLAGIYHGEYIRRQLTTGRVTIKQEIVAEVPQLKRLIAEFGKIGSNLNQVAHYYNSENPETSGMRQRLMSTLSELYDMKFEVEKMGGEFRGDSKSRLEAKHR